MPSITTEARNQLSPLLSHLCESLREDGHATRSAVFERIRRQLDTAYTDDALTEPLLRLTSFCALRQDNDPSSDPLIRLVLERVERLQGALASVQNPAFEKRH